MGLGSLDLEVYPTILLQTCDFKSSEHRDTYRLQEVSTSYHESYCRDAIPRYKCGDIIS